MDYLNESNLEVNHSPDEELFVTDESEFDEFEHHLSQYENKDDEELFNDDESMEHDGQSQDSQHQISLATSFCRNTQEQSENFLEDKFNGDLLLEHFSEDKFIKCKYSEDFYIEPDLEAKQQLTNESESDHHLDDHDKHIEERSSEDERVIENRKRHFLEFISTIPKVCTPSVCGTMSHNHRLDLSSRDQVDGVHLNNNHLSRLTEANEDILFEDDQNEFGDRNDEQQQEDKFDWSIDQLATLKPVDISFNERRFLRFKDFESDQLTQEKLTKENDMFFSQETIAPSPNKRVSFKNIGQELNDDNKVHQTAGKDEGKDSGNYTGDEDNMEQHGSSRAATNSELIDEFELSFIEHSNQRLSKIEFESEFKHQTNTPSRRKSLTNCNNRPNEWTNLDFRPNSVLQTSTPCTSLFRLNQMNQSEQSSNNSQFDHQHESFNQQREDDFIRKPTNWKMPLQERTSIKQKKRLFHNLSSNELSSSSQSSYSSTNDNSTNTSETTRKDEGIYDQTSSMEVTFGSSSMSVCDNNSLTPRPKKMRTSMAKSFAERLDEIELFEDDENNSNKSNAPDSVANFTNVDHRNSRCHSLTDSNCFVICKNFNNLLNNSDSGCYMSSNGSNSNSGLDAKRRALFN